MTNGLYQNTVILSDVFNPESPDDSRALSLGMVLTVGRSEKMGDGVTRTFCDVNGMQAKRVIQDLYGIYVGNGATWMLDGRIVANWFAALLESKYQAAVSGKVQIINPAK